MSEIKSYLREKYDGYLLSKEEAGKEMKLSPASLDRLRKRGEIKSKMIGGKVMFHIDEVARVLEAE